MYLFAKSVMADAAPVLPMHEKLIEQAVPIVESLDLQEAYSTSVLVNSALVQYTDNIISMLAFMFGILHQAQLSTSADYLVYIVLTAAIGLAIAHVSEYLGRPNMKWRPWLVQLSRKLMLIAGAYTTGLLARIVADWLFNGPSRGLFGLESLVMPSLFIVLIVMLLYRDQMTQTLPVDVIKSMDAPIKYATIAPAARPLPAPVALHIRAGFGF